MLRPRRAGSACARPRPRVSRFGHLRTKLYLWINTPELIILSFLRACLAAADAAEVDYAALMRQHKIKLTGLEPPNPIASLDALPDGSDVLKANWRKMGMDNPTAIQLAAWGVMIAVSSHSRSTPPACEAC